MQNIGFNKELLGTGYNVIIFISFFISGILLHELGHIFGLYLTNSKFVGISFNINELAAVVRGKTYNTQSKIIVILSGSLFSIICLGILKFSVIHKKHAYLNLAINTAILNEILYWSYSAFINYGDANLFLEIIDLNKIWFGFFLIILYLILFVFVMLEFNKEIMVDT